MLGTTILLLAAFLRLAAFDEALVGSDQSSILAAAAEIAALRDFPLVGIKSSVGVMQTALPAYLAALGWMLLPRVIAVKWLYAVLDLIALAFLFSAVKNERGWTAASIAGLLYATNPWLVEYNRWIWYQTLIPTFATVAFAGLLLTLSDRQRTGWPLTVAMSGAALMGLVHLASVPWAALLFLLGFVVAIRRRWLPAYAAGVGFSLIAAYPYLHYLIKTRFADVAMLLTQGGQSSSRNWAAYRLTIELLSGQQVLTTPRSSLWAESVVEPKTLYWVIPSVLGFAAIGALQAIHRRHASAYLLALGWTLAAPTIFVFTGFHLQHFYLLFIFPAPWVLIGMWSSETVPPQSVIEESVQRLALASTLIVSVWWAYLWGVRIVYESRGALRAPTRAWLMDRTVDRIGHFLNMDPQNEVIILTEFGGGLSPYDWMRNALNTDRVRIVPADRGLILPPDESCYLLGPGATPADLTPAASLDIQFEERSSMTVMASPPWRFFCYNNRPPMPAPLAQWRNGLTLLDTDIQGHWQASGTLNVQHAWHYRTRRDQVYHLFNHLTEEETLVTQADGAGVPTRFWRDDDGLITHFTLKLPETLNEETQYHLKVGAYTWPGLERVLLLDGTDAYTVETFSGSVMH